MSENKFQETVNALFQGMDGFISTKTVIGEPMHVENTIIIPLADVSFGVGAGVFAKEQNDNGGGGLGGKIQPTALLIIQDGTTKLVSIHNQGALNKVMDLVPDLINKFTGKSEQSINVEKAQGPDEEE